MTKIWLPLAMVMAALPATAGTKVIGRGPAMMTCGQVLDAFPGQDGETVIGFYIDGFLTATNLAASALGTLPHSGDVANNEKVADIVSKTLALCQSGKQTNFDSALMEVVIGNPKKGLGEKF